MKKSFLYLLITICSAINSYALPSIDVQNIDKEIQLFGPWAYSEGIFPSVHEKALQQKTINLPYFFDERLESAKTTVTLALSLETTPHQPLSIYIGKAYSVWALYVNGKYLGNSGKIGRSNDTHKGETNYPIIDFVPTSKTTTLLIHLANSEHNHIGLTNAPIIAPKGVIQKNKLQASYFELIVATIFFSFALYHFGLYLSWRRDKSPLWFSLLSLSLAVRSTTTSEVMILKFFPDISWEFLLRLEYFSGYIALPFFVLYIGALYPKQSSKIVEFSYLIASGFFLYFVVFLDTITFTTTLSYYQPLVLLFIFYTLWILIRSFKAKEMGSLVALVAFFLFSLTVIHDLLMFSNITNASVDLLPYGFFFYIIAQALILLFKYSKAFELIEHNTTNLEKIVATRTQELSNLASQRKLLLKELTHRVKNNLQFIIGLLWIQRKQADEKTNKSLTTLESQIQAIASVHETLCSQEENINVEIVDYLNNFIKSLKKIYPHLNASVVAKSPIYVKIDFAVSLGLLINELIVNHIKHNNDLETTPILITIKMMENLKVNLTYTDGYDHRDAFEKTKIKKFGLPNLGWPMIKEFVKQMESKMNVHQTYIELEFYACKDKI